MGIKEFKNPTGRSGLTVPCLAFLLMMIMTPIGIYKFNSIYHIAFPIASLILLFKIKILKVISSRNCIPLLVCLIIFTFFYIVFPDIYGRHNSITFMRGLVLFICGYALSRDPKRFSNLVIAICICFLMISFQMLGGLSLPNIFHSNRTSFVLSAANNVGLGYRGMDFRVMVTSFLWYTSFTSLLLISTFDYKSQTLRAISIFLFISTLLFCVLSLWTTPILIMIFGLVILLILKAEKSRGRITSRHVRRISFYCIAVVITIMIVLFVARQFKSYEGQYRAERLFFVFTQLLTGQGSYNDWNTATSGRLNRVNLSIDAFIRSPLIGVGDHSEKSGHSAFLDAFAGFGILGGIPVAVLLVYYMRISLLMARKEDEIPWTMASCASMLTMFFLISFLNPIIMSTSCEAIFFVVTGFVSGRYDYKIKKRLIIRSKTLQNSLVKNCTECTSPHF